MGNLLGGVIGGTGGMLAGDALDARSYEEFRDIWESNLQSKRGLIQGWFAAQGMMAPGIAAIEAAHGQDSIYGSIDLNDPIGYDTDYGSSGDGLSESGSGYDSTDRESDPFGGMGGYARGGVITRLMVPRGRRRLGAGSVR